MTPPFSPDSSISQLLQSEVHITADINPRYETNFVLTTYIVYLPIKLFVREANYVSKTDDSLMHHVYYVSHSALVHVVATMGVNTPLMQHGLEFHGKGLVNTPLKVDVIVNLKENNIKIESQPPQQEQDLIQIRYC